MKADEVDQSSCEDDWMLLSGAVWARKRNKNKRTNKKVHNTQSTKKNRITIKLIYRAQRPAAATAGGSSAEHVSVVSHEEPNSTESSRTSEQIQQDPEPTRPLTVLFTSMRHFSELS